jgi:hypothetical protein
MICTAAIRLYPLPVGIRKTPVQVSVRAYRCPLFLKLPIFDVGDHGFDCRISLLDDDSIRDDRWGVFLIQFLDSTAVEKYFMPFTAFYLWEGGFVGEGVILDQGNGQTPTGGT